MVGRAVLILAVFLAGTAAAQDSAPPVVAREAPALGVSPTDGEAVPVLPGSAASTPSATESAPLAVETDLASLVLKAHWVVQSVMAALVLAMVAVLTIFLFKLVEFALAFSRLRRARARLARVEGLTALPGDCPLALTSQAVQDEVASLPVVLTADLRAAARERLELRMDRIEAGAVRRLRSGGGLLASIGSVGPFVGLFGTVFGIMNSFLAIAATKTTNLSVVAPGIAEALLATGVGLVAAIPAVLLYNAVLRRVAAYRHGFADARAVLILRFSHELDRRMTGA